MKTLTLNLFASMVSLMLTGCDLLIDTPDNSSVLSLSTPKFLKQVRAIDQSVLILKLTVNGSLVEMSNQGGEWTGSEPVSDGDMANIELLWSENLPDTAEPLKLAAYKDTIGPITKDTFLIIDEGKYTTEEFDFDGDLISNYAERLDGSNPLVSTGSITGSEVETGDGGANPESLVDVEIKRVDTVNSPNNDGNYELIWRNAQWNDTSGKNLKIDKLILVRDGIEADEPNNFQWAAMHDGTYLYLWVFGEEADTATLHADSNYPWDDDTLELYLDGDYSRNTNYDEDDRDYLLFIPLLKKQLPFAANNINHHDHRKYEGANFDASGTWPDGVVFVNHLNSPGHRHAWEIQIELNQVGIAVGQKFGIELQYANDQDGDSRDAKWSWKNDEDSTWEHPNLMGTAILMDDVTVLP
ncbi:MAG: sugar-binding protein [Granulosicoccus sp.]